MRRLLGGDVIDRMKVGLFISPVASHLLTHSPPQPRSKAEMMRTWEEKVKFKFGCGDNDDLLEVTVPGVPDDPDLDIEDGFHCMTA